MVIRVSLKNNSRKQKWQFHIKVGSLVHDIFAREIVAALLDYLSYCIGNIVAVWCIVVALVDMRIILVHPYIPGLHRGIAPPLRVSRVLLISGGDDSLGCFKPHCLDSTIDVSPTAH